MWLLVRILNSTLDLNHKPTWEKRRREMAWFLSPVLVRTLAAAAAAAFWMICSHCYTGTEPGLWRGDFKLD